MAGISAAERDRRTAALSTALEQNAELQLQLKEVQRLLSTSSARVQELERELRQAREDVNEWRDRCHLTEGRLEVVKSVAFPGSNF